MLGKRTASILLVSGALALAAAAPASATVAYIHGTSDTTACTISTEGYYYAGCGGSSLFVGPIGDPEELDARLLIKFDIAGNVPANATINEAHLLLHVSGDTSEAENTTAHVLQTPWTTSATWTTADGTTSWDGGYPWVWWPEGIEYIDDHWIFLQAQDGLGALAEMESNNGWIVTGGPITFDGPDSQFSPALVVDYDS